MEKTADNVKIMQTNLSRNNFTQHGLHLNISGKQKMAELIAENMKQTHGNKRGNTHHSENFVS
jgi:lysophospholipase L1-like esterase